MITQRSNKWWERALVADDLRQPGEGHVRPPTWFLSGPAVLGVPQLRLLKLLLLVLLLMVVTRAVVVWCNMEYDLNYGVEQFLLYDSQVQRQRANICFVFVYTHTVYKHTHVHCMCLFIFDVSMCCSRAIAIASMAATAIRLCFLIFLGCTCWESFTAGPGSTLRCSPGLRWRARRAGLPERVCWHGRRAWARGGCRDRGHLFRTHRTHRTPRPWAQWRAAFA